MFQKYPPDMIFWQYLADTFGACCQAGHSKGTCQTAISASRCQMGTTIHRVHYGLNSSVLKTLQDFCQK